MHDPRISTFQALAEFFGVSIDKLYASSPDFYDDHKPVMTTQSIPIISWQDCLKGNSFVDNLHANNWNQWLVTENLGKHLYGVKTKPSMEPRFSEDSVLIINPSAIPADGNIIVVHYPETSEATLRRILIDGPRKELALINDEGNQELYKDDVSTLGVVSQVRMDF